MADSNELLLGKLTLDIDELGEKVAAANKLLSQLGRGLTTEMGQTKEGQGITRELTEMQKQAREAAAATASLRQQYKQLYAMEARGRRFEKDSQDAERLNRKIQELRQSIKQTESAMSKESLTGFADTKNQIKANALYAEQIRLMRERQRLQAAMRKDNSEAATATLRKELDLVNRAIDNTRKAISRLPEEFKDATKQ